MGHPYNNENEQPSQQSLDPEHPLPSTPQPRRRVWMLLAFLLITFILLIFLHEGFTAFLKLLIMLLIRLVIRVLDIAFRF